MSQKKPSTKQNMYTLMVLKLLKELKKKGKVRLSIREVGRILKINPMAVSRAVKILEPILDIKKGSDFESFRLPLTLIRLRDGVKNLSLEELIEKTKLSNRLLKEVYKP